MPASRRRRTRIAVGLIFLLLASALIVLERREHTTRRVLRDRGIVSVATVVSREGPYADFGRRYPTERFYYWLEYGGQRHRFPSRRRFHVGERFRLIYDSQRTSVARILRMDQTGREDPGVDWRYAVFAVPCALVGIIALWSAFRRVQPDQRRQRGLFASIRPKQRGPSG